MATDRKLDERISSWLEAEAPAQLPDRVLRATFERTRGSRQQVGVRTLLGRINMPRPMLAIGGAAVVVVAAFVALNAFGKRDDSSGQASPGPSPIVSPESSAALPSAGPTSRPVGLLDPGPHVLWTGAGVMSVPMTVTIPAAGWYGETGDGIVSKNDTADPPDGAGLIAFGGDDLYVYGDPCDWSATKPEAPSTTVTEFVVAMRAQALRNASKPVDVTVGGYPGKSITVHVPDDADFAECDQGFFGSWGVPGEPTPSRYSQGPGQIDKLWIFDIDGELVVIDTTYYAGTPTAVVDELDAIVASMTFD
jgi:hypothetical protein